MRPHIVLFAIFAFLATPAAAFDPARMTDAERSAFRAEVRNYLMENPEVLMEAITALQNREAADQVASDAALVQANAAEIFNDSHSWVGGNPDGDITLVEFTDYRCGYCRKAFGELRELVATDGNIRLVIKEFPILGEQSLLSSRFAIATRIVAGDAAYEQVHDALITLRGDATPDAVTRIGNDLGLDTPAILAAMDSAAVTDALDQNSALGAALAINGTPTFVLGEQILRGYLPLPAMRDLVAQARSD